MKNRIVKDLMIPEKEFVKIKESATIIEAAEALKKAIKVYTDKNLLYDCVLVESNSGKITGKVSCADIVKALEPKYSRTGDSDEFSKSGVSHFGLSPDYIKHIVSRYDLWNESLEQMIDHAADLKVSKFMFAPDQNACLNEDSTLADAIHHMTVSQHHSVLVFNNNKITGIISMRNIFTEVCTCIEKK